MSEVLEDGTLSFLPVRLNSQPAVLGGLTADEMWGTVLVSCIIGLVLGAVLTILTYVWALIIVGALVGGVLGLTVASRLLRRWKRGRPDTWLYRQIQLKVAQHFPTWNSAGLITHTGAWVCRRRVCA